LRIPASSSDSSTLFDCISWIQVVNNQASIHHKEWMGNSYTFSTFSTPVLKALKSIKKANSNEFRKYKGVLNASAAVS
jgi:hypothetical protein